MAWKRKLKCWVFLNCQLQKIKRKIAKRENLINWIIVWPLSHLYNLILCPSNIFLFFFCKKKIQRRKNLIFPSIWCEVSWHMIYVVWDILLKASELIIIGINPKIMFLLIDCPPRGDKWLAWNWFPS